MASNGAEPVGSLGYDGPLAALSPERQNLADYFKETVAVVTNPAIDREREMEHFSTRAAVRPPPLARRRRRGHRHGRNRLPGDPRRPPRPGAALRQDLPPDRPRAPHLPARGPLGGVPRPRRRRRHLPARVGDDQRRDRADQAGGGEEGPRRRRAAGPHRPHRLRRRAPLPRPAPGDLGGRPGAEAVQGRAAARRTCAAAAGSSCARRRSATSTTRCWPSGSAPTASARTRWSR